MKLGLIGQNISYTLSAPIHSLAARELGLTLDYEIFDISKESLGSVLDFCWRQGYEGLNVTSPFKLDVVPLLEEYQSFAVNTLYRGKSFWRGLSTDGSGFLKALNRWGYQVHDFEQLGFLGNGGVVASLLEALASKDRVPPITIFRRSGSRDSLITERASANQGLSFAPFTPEKLRSWGQLSSQSLLIQATSAPHQGQDLSFLINGFQSFRGFLADLDYNPPSFLYSYAKEKSRPCFDGLPMLIEQALASQQVWWGEAGCFEGIYQKIRNHGRHITSSDNKNSSTN